MIVSYNGTQEEFAQKFVESNKWLLERRVKQ